MPKQFDVGVYHARPDGPPVIAVAPAWSAGPPNRSRDDMTRVDVSLWLSPAAAEDLVADLMAAIAEATP